MSSTELTQLWQTRFGAAPAVPQSDDVFDNDGADTIRLLMRHRTHRLYTDEPIAEETLNTLLGCALSAPSKSDLQQTSIVVVEDADLRQAIAGLIPAMPWIARAATFLVFLADGYRIEQVCAQRKKPFANDNLDNFLSAVSDASLALQNTIIAAQALGLGCCPISVIRNHMAEIAALLDLPRRVVPLAGLCLGYPAREGYVSMRLPPAVSVHRNRYAADRLREELDAYDRQRDARFSIADDAQKYTREYGVADFYGWSEDKARQMSKPERAGVGDFVRKAGFALT